jgi:hypothetical protein
MVGNSSPQIVVSRPIVIRQLIREPGDGLGMLPEAALQEEWDNRNNG